MPTPKRFLRWEQGRDVIDRLVASKELDRVTASHEMAALLLADSERHLETARKIAKEGLDLPAAYTVSYDAARKALAAVLQIQGLRPSSRGGHTVIGLALEAQLNKSDELKAFQVMRRTRNLYEYPSDTEREADPEEIRDQIEDTEDIIAYAWKLIDILPPYGK